MHNRQEVAAALHQIARGVEALAEAIAGGDQQAPQEDRVLEVLREWGPRGLDRAEASALFRRHGFSPQAAGGWVRGEWLETRDDGRRYLTDRSWRWMNERSEETDG